MLTQLTSSKDIAEVYRFIFIFLSGGAFSYLLYKTVRNKHKSGNTIFALIYFGVLFSFYILRLCHIPSDVYIANMISNTIHLLAAIFIFSIALILLGGKSK